MIVTLPIILRFNVNPDVACVVFISLPVAHTQVFRRAAPVVTWASAPALALIRTCGCQPTESVFVIAFDRPKKLAGDWSR